MKQCLSLVDGGMWSSTWTRQLLSHRISARLSILMWCGTKLSGSGSFNVGDHTHWGQCVLEETIKMFTEYDIWLWAKCKAKMAGYWPSSFLRVCGPR